MAGKSSRVDKDRITYKELGDLEDGYKDYSFKWVFSDKISIHISLPDIMHDR